MQNRLKWLGVINGGARKQIQLVVIKSCKAFAVCQLLISKKTICREALAMLHTTAGQTNEMHKSSLLIIVRHSSEFYLWLKQISFTVKSNGQDKLTAKQR